MPYAAFWFADALGLEDERFQRRAGLSLVYSSLATTLSDDIVDGSPGTDSNRARLARLWSRRYLATLRTLFPSVGEFRRSAAWSDAEWRRYKGWSSRPLGTSSQRPFSEGFLGESSRYFVAVVLPTLGAVASASGKRTEVPRIERFLKLFSMGWRIFDDLMDWEKDLDMKGINRSSVLNYMRNRTAGGASPGRLAALSWFMSEDFIDDAYGALLGYLGRARKVAKGFGGGYLDEFMEQQVGFHKEKRKEMLRSADATRTLLNERLSTVLGPAGSRPGRQPRGPRPRC